jgi:hypothetical protein
MVEDDDAADTSAPPAAAPETAAAVAAPPRRNTAARSLFGATGGSVSSDDGSSNGAAAANSSEGEGAQPSTSNDKVSKSGSNGSRGGGGGAAGAVQPRLTVAWADLELEPVAFARGGGGQIFKGRLMANDVAAKQVLSGGAPEKEVCAQGSCRGLRVFFGGPARLPRNSLTTTIKSPTVIFITLATWMHLHVPTTFAVPKGGGV